MCDSELTYQGSGLHQGGLVQLENGDWWAIIFQDYGKHGRIPFLLPVEWKDGWPETKPVLTYKKPAVEAKSASRIINPDRWRSDTFDNAGGIGRQWQWNHHPAADGWSLTERPGRLRLKPLRTSGAIRETQNVLVQQIFGPGDSAQVTLDYSALKDGDIAGLGLFSQHCSFIAAVRENGKTRLAVMRQLYRDGKYVTQELGSVDPTEIAPHDDSNTARQGQVVIRADIPYLQYAVRYSYSTDGGKSFRELGSPLGMPCEFFSDWLAVRYCLFDYARTETGGYADFDDFKTERKTSDPYPPATTATCHAQLCDAYQNMSKPAFVWVTDPNAPPNLYLKWPNTSRIGTGIHDAASWTEAFEARERRWILFDRVRFREPVAGVRVRASGKGRIVLRACRGYVRGEIDRRSSFISCTPGIEDLSGECEAPEALPSGSPVISWLQQRQGRPFLLTGMFEEPVKEVEIGSVQVDSEEMKNYTVMLKTPIPLIPDPNPGPHGYIYSASSQWPIRVVLEPEEGSSLRFRSMTVSH